MEVEVLGVAADCKRDITPVVSDNGKKIFNHLLFHQSVYLKFHQSLFVRKTFSFNDELTVLK